METINICIQYGLRFATNEPIITRYSEKKNQNADLSSTSKSQFVLKR
jgi:hypothetical protein